MKRGNVILDMPLWFFLLILLAITLLMGHKIQSSVNDMVQVSDMSDVAKASLQGTTERYASSGDNIFVMAVVLMSIFVFAASFLIDTHPLFFGISVFLLIFVFIVGAILVNFYDAVSDASDVASDFPKMTFIMGHLLEIGIAVGFLTLVGLFGKAVSG